MLVLYLPIWTINRGFPKRTRYKGVPLWSLQGFTNTLQHRVTTTGTHYVLSIPREIAQALDMQVGGLCSIEMVDKLDTNKKAVVILK